MTKLLTSPWMSVPIGAIIYLGATVLFWKTPPVPKAETSETPAMMAHLNGPSWDFTNPEADQLMAELRAEKQSLEKREQQLSELELRIQSERDEMARATQAVHQVQIEFDKNVVRVQEEETGNLKRLAKVYAAMAPESAANICSELDDSVIGKIMLFMKDSETAGILEAMAKRNPGDAKRAAAISERLRLSAYRNPQTTAAK